MGDNRNLHKAKAEKNDEFYTQLSDIEKEMVHYKDHFRDKVVLCNCDDPYESNFFRYFVMNFTHLGLKALICTCYDGSPVAGGQLSLPGMERTEDGRSRRAYMACIDREMVARVCPDGIHTLKDAEKMLRHKGAVTMLKGNGDFRSDECVELLELADIVVTNPPFSLFREYIAQLVEHDKKFIVLGNMNAITYKEIFPHMMHDELWLGPASCNGGKEYGRPDGSVQNLGNTYWFTNLDYPKRHEPLILCKRYTPEEYPRYDNYDAIEVSKVADIPEDYFEEEYTVETVEELERLKAELDARGRRYTVEEI